MTIVTVEEMTKAIGRTLVAHGKLDADSAEKVAVQVLSYFGSELSVLDNVLTPEDRDIFYRLEEEGLLSSEVESATVDKGKNWRIHYWLLNTTNIHSKERKVDEPGTEPGAVYKKLSQEGWARGGN